MGNIRRARCRGCAVGCFLAESLHGGPEQSANDKLCRLLFFIGALKDAGARRVTALVPYLCYREKTGGPNQTIR